MGWREMIRDYPMLIFIIGLIIGAIAGFFWAAMFKSAKIGDSQPGPEEPENRESSGDDRNITGGDA